MFQTLLFSQHDAIATITFNRPQAMNCFNRTMANELKTITDQVKADDSIRAVLLNGAGHLFMAGGDIQFFYENLSTMPAGVLEIVQTLNVSILNLMQMPKPILASVHGSVAGVGMSLMMACDLVIAADNAKFTMAYSGIGISPDGGASYNLPRIVGTKKAMEWLLMSEVFDVAMAKTHGLINWIATAENLAAETERLLTKLASGPTFSFAQTKRLVNDSWQQPVEKHLAAEGHAFESCCASADFKSGVVGFLKKLKPQFVGK